MSARAIRALRGDNDALLRRGSDDEDDEDSSIEDSKPAAKVSAFSAMMESSSSDEEESSSEDEIQHDQSGREKQTTVSEVEVAQTEEDFDALLDEFAKHDVQRTEDEMEEHKEAYFGFILQGLDPRDLDVDYSMRNSLMGTSETTTPPPPRVVSRGSRPALLFGPARDGWTRPPHYVGGGMGMTTYDKDPRELPWPYNCIGQKDDDDDETKETTDESEELFGVADLRQWFTFLRSDNYARDCQDYDYIQQSGDLNALVMFVAHHPYVTDALLQLATVLYQTNHSQEGLSLLRRCLWVYESSALMSFTRNMDGSAFMDMDQPENATFFKSIFQLMRVSRIAGLPRTAASVGRYLFSLDPLRDPMRVLAVMDAHVISSNTEEMDQWLVDVVDGKRVSIQVRKSGHSNEKYASCDLLELPNWSYSYALALYRLSQQNDDLRGRADMALKNAMRKFPDVPGRLLQDLEVDTTGRSFRRDWVTVLDAATDRFKASRRRFASSCDDNPEDVAPTIRACDVLVQVYIGQVSKQWGDDHVLQWVYEKLASLMTDEVPQVSVLNRAIMRYADCNPSDFENKIQLLPQDANILDGGMVAHAMAVNPNRPRFLRNMQAARGLEGAGLQRQGHAAGFAGPPTQVIDPDWPVLEVFWRSFLPWNHVDGVPPPPPPRG